MHLALALSTTQNATDKTASERQVVFGNRFLMVSPVSLSFSDSITLGAFFFFDPLVSFCVFSNKPYYTSRGSLPSSAPRVNASAAPRPVPPPHVYPQSSQMMMIPQQQLQFPPNSQGHTYFISGQVLPHLSEILDLSLLGCVCDIYAFEFFYKKTLFKLICIQRRNKILTFKRTILFNIKYFFYYSISCSNNQ